MPKKITIAQLFKEEWSKPVQNHPIFCSGQKPSPTCPEQKHWIETYSPSKRRGYSYYRYVWRERGKLHHRHLPGGNVRSLCARALKERVESAIADGLSPVEIEQLIKSNP